jgi:S-adenosylmethionine hydrolase
LGDFIITLLSDLGTSDSSVALVKAALMERAPGVAIVDIAHNVAAYDVRQAAYLLFSGYQYFAAGAVHVVMVDVFAGEQPRILLAHKDGHWFVVPDNGMLQLAFGSGAIDTWLCYELSRPFAFHDWVSHAAGVAAIATLGGTLPYPPYSVEHGPTILEPKITTEGIECRILHIDRYENVTLDITKTEWEQVASARRFHIRTMRLGAITSLSYNYNDVSTGEPLCRFNSAGYLEIAVNHGSAAASLGLNTDDPAGLRYRTIKILMPATLPA